MNISARIASELGVKVSQVDATISLLDGGSTVPFIARYRKEATAGLDDTQLRYLHERLGYLREMEERRTVILKSIDEQGKLTGELKQSIVDADTKTRLEDLYAPYKPKRRTKAQIAREAGIEPLLDALLADPNQSPAQLAEQFINVEAGFADAAATLEGAKNIFMERAGEEADLVGRLRDYSWENASLTASVVEGKQVSGSKFKDYFDYSEALEKIPSHRALALFRAREEGVLRLKMHIPKQDDLQSLTDMGVCDSMVANHFNIAQRGQLADSWLLECARWSWRIKLSLQIETEQNMRIRESAEAEAIRVFGENLRDLLLAAPAGGRVTLGLDPGLRTGVKVVVVDNTGKLTDQTTIYPHQPRNQWDSSINTLAKMAARHNIQLVSIGNGTASRETDKLVKELIKRHPELRLNSLVVSEAGASVYSASELAAKEFPDVDVSIRGAISIARRLQDPLSELVKIDPKSIGVGQYQHDVNQSRLVRKLDAVVEDCVNAVGVEVNTASVPLLSNVAGLSEALASNVVAYREQHGAFNNRQQLLNVPRLGPKAFEQAAGFLRIRDSANPLDASAVHPEAYALVERILKKADKNLSDIIGDSKFLKNLVAEDYTDDVFGEPTVRDIIAELDKPGRDPRPEFKTAEFKDGIEKVNDLKPGMILEGVITNVTNFGAFVDIGVHQDGLVHISALAESYVKDPRQIVKTGDIVKVKVMSVDAKRDRIGLSMRLTDKPESEETADGVVPVARAGVKTQQTQRGKPGLKQPGNVREVPNRAPMNNAMAAAFSKLKQ